MINRVLIRIRVVQILYAAQISNNKDLKKIENDLILSIQKSYDLYYYILLLFIELKNTYSKKIEQKKGKLLPNKEDINPNTRLLENKFIIQLENNKQLEKYLSERPLSWDDNAAFVKKLLDSVLGSDIYKNYISSEQNDYESDKKFCRDILKHLIDSEDLDDLLEEESIYWNDDIPIILSFVQKTIKNFEQKNEENQPLLPMFKDDEDNEFAIKLLRTSLLDVNEYSDLVSKYAKNWESERIAVMDQIIMQTAISELINFPNIPISVTLNEYINISKTYSTNKSASFINGILDAVVSDLKREQKIVKK